MVLGGGVAGLYSAAALAKSGYSVLLIERQMLGAGQTIASQGILHGGIKYTLGGEATAASKAVADMPARWHAAMSNASGADPDLRGVRVLSPAQYLWTAGSFFSKITARVAAAAIRTAVDTVPPSQACPGLHQAKGTTVYRVEEPVIDPRSLLQALESAFQSAGGRIGVVHDSPSIDEERRELRLGRRAVRFSTLVLAAGEGNHTLLAPFGVRAPAMQRRPLRMVMARSTRAEQLPALFGHCIAAMSDKPRITVTTQAQENGKAVWYIGGQIAESGVERTPEAQIAAARLEVSACLPWIDLSHTEWTSFTIDRAEGLMRDGSRPDLPVVAPVGATGGAILAVWPTKLVFAPLVADMVKAEVSRHVQPSRSSTSASSLDGLRALAAPQIAPLPWDREDIQWT